MSKETRFTGTDTYVASDDLMASVEVATKLQKPLLIKGEPGTGKTMLAEAVAKSLDMELLIWNIKSTTKAQDGLYIYDTIQRLYDSQFGVEGVDDISRYIKLGKLGEAFKKDRQVVLLIDEIDATLHPAAQKRLIDLLVKEAKINNIQVVVTTHSSDLLKHICNKTAYNNDSKNNDVELYYFTNANRRLEMKRNPEYSTIENDLLVESMFQNSNNVKVYSEDAENRWFISKLLPEYLPYVDILNVKIGCDQLLSLYTGDISYFGNVLIVLDGDVQEKDLQTIPEQLRKRLNNIITLPGDVRPEEVIYKYILDLEPEHPYWENAAKVDMNWTYFKENGPDSAKYNQEKEREKYKKWFVEHQAIFDSTKLYDFWAVDNKELVEEFKKNFVNAYNAVASRIFAITIKSE